MPDSPRNRDVGDIAVIEHDGSSYDRKLPDGTSNYEGRARVGLRFYQTHPDDYDFVVVFTNFEFDSAGGLAFHSIARNDVEGIGKPVGSVDAAPFGSRSRLKGWIDMAALSRYQKSPYSLERGGPDFLRTLGVLAHEVGHQWLAEARYKVGETVYDDLLGADESHWSYLLDSDGSFLYGADWQPNGDGTWNSVRVREQYAALDLYLMGLLPQVKVPPLTLLRNPAVDRHQINAEGDDVAAGETTAVSIDQVVAALGPRKPDFAHSQKDFRLGFVFLTAPGTEPSAEDLEAVERVRRAFGAYFFALTNGVGWADTSLGAAGPVERAARPDMERALAWLAAQQDLDGSWADAPETRARDSATAVLALARARAGQAALPRGITWLRGAQPESLDFQARVAASLDPSLISAGERQAHVSLVLAGQNPDGGWGAARDFASDALDTALALRALKALGHPLDVRVTRGVAALAALANADGGWSGVLGGETSTVGTAEALLALLDWSDAPGSAGARGRGLALLQERRNPDGGFGSSPSNPHAGALALEVLLRSGAGEELIEPLVAWLQQTQLADGSWASSSYQTALVVSVLGQSLGANLVVPSVSAEPNPVAEGDEVHVTATVRNVGRAKASPTSARLHDGDPSGAPLASAPVPELEPGGEAEVSFEYGTADRPGRRTLYVVADGASQLRESREDDNTTSVNVTVNGPLADLVVRPEGVIVDPAAPAIGEDATLLVRVDNAGERAASAFAVSVQIATPSGTSLDLPVAAVGGLAAGGTAAVSLSWSPQEAGPHVIRVKADSAFAVPESDETNGETIRPVQVLDAVPDGAELAVAQASIVPGALVELPQAIELRAVVVNSGQTGAITQLELRDGFGQSLGRVLVEVPARGQAVAVLDATLLMPGNQVLSAVVDPDGVVAEADESDNTFRLAYPDARTVDVEIVSATASAAEVELGGRVTVSAEVRNRGTMQLPVVRVQLAHDALGGPSELDVAVLRLNPGESQVVELEWRAAILGDVPLLVRADPFDDLAERREDDNGVALAIRVGPSGRPNLSVSGGDVTLDPDPLVEGSSATVAVVVRNTGGVDAPDSILRFFVGDPATEGRKIGEATVGPLAAGASRTVSLAWQSVDVRGSLGLFVVADAGSAVDESNEDDNRAFRPFSSIGLPDLVLTRADVTLGPAYPREGDGVTIHATVRNLGARPSGPTTLEVAEGDAASQTVVGQLPVAALDPGGAAPLSLSWTPAAPVGERSLILVVDREDAVREQDEGNNSVARSVVVQDADLFVSEPFFSPDGDGVKDTTTVAWRATAPVARLVVASSRGEVVRTLVELGEASGSATWDGRDERGLVAADGSYRFILLGERGVRLGDVAVELDTNRSLIHDAIPGRTTVRNLTCALPDLLRGPALMPAEDEGLFIVPDSGQGFPVGLLRVGSRGEQTYVAQDDWYRFADFAAPVSPDGREALLRGPGGVHVVDLTTGERRLLGSGNFSSLEWSPDGRFIRTDGAVLGRDGSTIASFWRQDARWAPSSDRLAWVDWVDGDDTAHLGRVEIVARDGTPLDTILVPKPQLLRLDEFFPPRELVWRGDGRIVATFSACRQFPGDEAETCEELSFVVDPDARDVRQLGFSAWQAVWSLDGSRVLLPDGELRLENGTSLGPLLPAGATVGPRVVSATFRKNLGEENRPGTVCGGKFVDTFLVSSSANLVAELELAVAAGNGGVVVRGTATDRNLESFQLEYTSTAGPASWTPIGAALDVPVLDDLLTVWVPPGPGTYVLRLTVSDRAGHTSVRTRTVAWDRKPVLANFTQSDYYLSPEVNGVKDTVLFKYTVISPTRVDVRVVGPEPAGADEPAAREVLRTAFEYPNPGPQSFTWDGKNAFDQVAPDGRYTVYINGLPFRVELDNTPPEIGMRLGGIDRSPAPIAIQGPGEDKCYPEGLWLPSKTPYLKLSSLIVEREWHVVDEGLKSWRIFDQAVAGRVVDFGNEPIFVGDPASPLHRGMPKARRENGHPIDRTDIDWTGEFLGIGDLKLEAWDLAGNHSEVSVAPLTETLVPIGAVDRKFCEPLHRELKLDTGTGTRPTVNALRPDKLVMQVGTTLGTPDPALRFVLEPVDGGAERTLEVPGGAFGGYGNLDIESFEQLGIDPTLTYRGRFTGESTLGRIESAPFVFSPCKELLRADIFKPDLLSPLLLTLKARLDNAVAEVKADLELKAINGARTPLGTVTLEPAPQPPSDSEFRNEVTFSAWIPDLTDCSNKLVVSVTVTDVAGVKYPSTQPGQRLEKACQRLSFEYPGKCGYVMAFEQTFNHCASSPDTLVIQAHGGGPAAGRVTIETGPPSAPRVLDEFDFVPEPVPSFSKTYEIPVEDYTGDSYPIRGKIVPFDPLYLPGTDASLDAVVDRLPPLTEFLLPPDGSLICLSREPGPQPLNLQVHFDDAGSPTVVPQAASRKDGGPWTPLPRICNGPCKEKEETVPVGPPLGLSWNGQQLEAGAYDFQLQACDRSGNRATATRRLLVTRDPPAFQIRAVQPDVFSPNGDGKLEQTQVTVRLASAGLLSARIHAGSAKGPLVRTLMSDVPQSATDVALFWDGRNDAQTVVADGEYAIVVSIADACGGASEQSARIVVDTTPPATEITEPSGGQRVSASVDVLGAVADAHLSLWQLEVSCGSSGWKEVARRTYQVQPGSFLARWDTSLSPEGECHLRLVAEDRAQNRSPEAFAAATVERGAFLEAVSATPEIFSPNGDGRRETATIGYRLARPARVSLEVRDGQGRVLRSFESLVERAAGPWSHVWDGRDGAGRPAPEGLHAVWVRAEDPAVSTVYEEKTLRLDVDRTPPKIDIARPTADAMLAPAALVRGALSDRNFAAGLLSAAPVGGSAVELARLSVPVVSERDIAGVSMLAEGPHVLFAEASDAAENETKREVPFLMDATPPRAQIQSPASGSILRRGEQPIPVTALVTDAHLASWTLRFAEGPAPAVWAPIAEGASQGASIGVGSWDVRFVPDGTYTLSLVATDRAELTAESRVVVVLDGTSPTAVIAQPRDGGYVTAPGPVVGTAADQNLRSWKLEWAPGAGAQAFQWSALAESRTVVGDGPLVDWSPLPPDGVYSLKLVVQDEVELVSTAQIAVTVDTTPPAPPKGLRSIVKPERQGYGDVDVLWNANTEPDLAGYRVRRLPEESWSDLVGPPVWDDGERLEGRYTYEVLAEDKAGNRSAPSKLDVLVDLTPPLVAFANPAADASVAGAVDVRGTAWSADDFAEYRLLVGVGETPSTWSLLRRSSTSVAGGRLGDWLALTDGPHVLALEAEDKSGNQARATRRVVVDTQPPDKPVLVEVAKPGPAPDMLVPTWRPGTATDVVGTLVYRNGRLANASGIVIGDRRGFAVPGTSYQDLGLPDGDHCYTVVAIDGAANESLPSNEICETLDNRAPRAVIVHPPNGTRFGYPVRVIAETPDLDVASVRFERRAEGTHDWVAFGTPLEQPWETTLDPNPPGGPELTAGRYELRAVASDRTGHVDLAPPSITVVYGDTTPPPAPEGLAALVDAADVTLTWTAVTAADLASYRVYRDGERIAEGVFDASFADPGRSLATYRYTVTSVDADGNESEPSGPADATIYSLELDQAVWPVVATATGSVTGSGARPSTTVAILRDDASIAEAAASDDLFRVDGVPLAADGNRLVARGRDAAGNRSIPSQDVVLISNSAPGEAAGLEAQVTGSDVSLSWTAVPDADLAGCVVRRDGKRLSPVVEQLEASLVGADPVPWQARDAWDANPATSWDPEGSAPASWTITFSEPVLVESVRIRFGSNDSRRTGIAADYTIRARWQDRNLPILRVRGNTRLVAEHRLPAPFLTTGITILLESTGGLAEVDVLRLEVQPPGTESFVDEDVADGRHTYEVAAIDQYGALGAAASVEAAVGDVDPPAAPIGLAAVPAGRDVHLTWRAGPEPDVTGYAVLRDGARIATTIAAAYVDAGRPNGTYTYTVRAVDAAGHESEPSNAALATIDVQPTPPPAPVILEPTDAAHPIALAASHTDVAGQAVAGATVSLEVGGTLRGTAIASPGFRPLPPLALESGSDAALSLDGKRAAWSGGVDAVVVQDVDAGTRQTFALGGNAVARQIRFSPDAKALALVRVSQSSFEEELVRLTLADGAIHPVEDGPVGDHAWSPDGATIAVSLGGSSGGRLSLVAVATGQRAVLSEGIGLDRHLRFSPDGRRLAYVRSWWDVAELHVLDLASSRVQVLDPNPSPSSPPSWSGDSRRLAWTTVEGGDLRVRVQDIGGASTDLSEPGNDLFDPRFSPDGEWLSSVRRIHLADGSKLRGVQATHQPSGLTLTVAEPVPAEGAPEVHEWTGGRLSLLASQTLSSYVPEAGWFVVHDVALDPGENVLVARATDSASGLTSPDSAPVQITTVEGAFPDLVVTPDALLLSPALARPGQPAEIRVRVRNAGGGAAEAVTVRVRVTSAGAALVLDTEATLPLVGAGSEVTLLVPWTPALAGSYTLTVELDPGDRLTETSESNNTASRELVVTAATGLAGAVESDRPSYPPQATAHATVRLANPGQPFQGSARTTVEDATGAVLEALDDRPVALDWGRNLSYVLDWNTRTTWAGLYKFVVRVHATDGSIQTIASREFEIQPAVAVLARVRPQRVTLGEGEPAAFALGVQNQAVNAPLEGATARLRVQLDAVSGPARYETVRGLPKIRPGESWEVVDTWSEAQPPGRYRALFEVEKDGAVVASSTAFVTVQARAGVVGGELTLAPAEVLAGETVAAKVRVANTGTASVAGYPLSVEIVSGQEAQVLLSEPATVDLAAGASSELTVPLSTAAILPGRLSVRLRGGAPPATLDVESLVVHGAFAPPSHHSPPDGSRVAADHPLLVVNNASSPEQAALVYEFELYGDAQLVQALPGVRGVPETASRTSWRVAARLDEDTRYWWRSRATDGFSQSPWSALASFTVDAVDEPVRPPLPDTPASGARVASRQPPLSVRNALDPEGEPLSYEFRLSRNAEMTDVVASQSGIAEGLGLTGWTPTLALDEDSVYYWSARASTGGGGPEDVSAWSVPVWFLVDTLNGSPSPPLPLRPVGGARIATRSPALVVENATDPENDPLTYRFEIDSRPSLDSAQRQESAELAGGPALTAWTPESQLVENTVYYWRAHASDARTETPSVVESFFVNAVNEAPSAPVLLDPVDGRTVGSATPSLCLRNVLDPDGDPLAYDFEVRDAAGGVAAAIPAVPADSSGTTCAVVPTPLAEDGAFTWTARASDGALQSPWTDPPAAFRVDAVAEPPTAPAPLLPGDGATIVVRRPTLVVQNATSPDGRLLVYTFELEAVAADGTTSLVERTEGVAETPDTTAWTPSDELVDGSYQWRAQASDSKQDGPWSTTFHFTVLVHQPLSAPRDLRAVAGDARARLDWIANPEPSVVGYRIYRSTTSGGPYTSVGTAASPGFDDLGLTNGVTYSYVVTAFDPDSESERSNEASARPEAPGVLDAEVRFDPPLIRGECLLPLCGRGSDDDDDDDDDDDGDDHGKGGKKSAPLEHHHVRPADCPQWLYATLELSNGYDPASIQVASLLAFGSVRADTHYSAFVDVDGDGLRELRVRFLFDEVAPLLRVGVQNGVIVGRAGAPELRGIGRLEVSAVAADLRITPRTLQKRSKGEDILAKITFASGISAEDVALGSVRLNGVVPIDRVVERDDDELKVKFDRAEVIRVLPTGEEVEVRVTGTIQGLPFVAVDYIRVIE